MTASAPNLAVHTIADARVVEFSRADLIDAALIRTIGDEIYDLVKGTSRPKLVIDFQKVERLSSAALSMLIALHKVISRRSGQLRLANVSDGVSDVFKITKLDSVLKICGSTQEAVDSLA